MVTGGQLLRQVTLQVTDRWWSGRNMYNAYPDALTSTVAFASERNFASMRTGFAPVWSDVLDDWGDDPHAATTIDRPARTSSPESPARRFTMLSNM